MWKTIVLFVVAVGTVAGIYVSSPKRISIVAIDNMGALEDGAGEKVWLSRVSMPSVGDENYEKAMFLLSEMTKNTGLWIKPESDGYLVWMGCREVIGVADCRKGLLINEALIRAGVVSEN